MNKVFIGGSIRLLRLNDDIKQRLNNIVQKGYSVLIGDANGVDKAVQQYLFDKNYRNVFVYCVGEKCRNNVGHWKTKWVKEHSKVKDFHYYTIKDLEMVKDTDYGFMIWDTKSKGTLNNIVNLLRENKTVIVYVSKDKIFYTLHALSDLEKLLAKCDKNSLESLERKLQLSQRAKKKQEEFNFAQQYNPADSASLRR
jgi:hypothetical protein